MLGVKNKWTFKECILLVILIIIMIIILTYEYYLLTFVNIPLIIYIGYLDYKGNILLESNEGGDEDYLKFKFLMKLDSIIRTIFILIMIIGSTIQRYIIYPNVSIDTSLLISKTIIITYIIFIILYSITYIWGNRELKKLYKKLGIENN